MLYLLSFLQVLEFFSDFAVVFLLWNFYLLPKVLKSTLKFCFLSGTIYQRDLMNKLLLYIILVLMQICSTLVIQIMIFVEMDKTGIFSIVLLYCQTLQNLISLFCLILSVNFDQTFWRNCSWSCSGV